jgi:hypothetical protein
MSSGELSSRMSGSLSVSARKRLQACSAQGVKLATAGKERDYAHEMFTVPIDDTRRKNHFEIRIEFVRHNETVLTHFSNRLAGFNRYLFVNPGLF